MKRLRRSYTALELDMGQGMKFHPVTRTLLDCVGVKFDRGKTIFFYEGGCRWHYYRGDLPRIGDGGSRKKGDPYLDHWRFDPYTGRELQKKKQEKEPCRPFLTGWEME